MASQGKDGITYYSWHDLFQMMDEIKFPDRTSRAWYEVEAMPRLKDAPMGRLRVRAHAIIWGRNYLCKAEGSSFTFVRLTRRVYLANNVREALVAAKDQAREIWVMQHGTGLGCASE